MSIPVWPSDLPQRPLRQGFGISSPDGRLTTRMEKGPPQIRRGFSSAVRPVEAAFQVDLNGALRFDRFWAEQTKFGSLPFLLPDPRTEGVSLASELGQLLTDEAGRPLLVSAWWLVLFGEKIPDAVNTAGAIYRISFQLMVLP